MNITPAWRAAPFLIGFLFFAACNTNPVNTPGKTTPDQSAPSAVTTEKSPTDKSTPGTLRASAIGDGLAVRFYDNQDFTGTQANRIDPTVDLTTGSGTTAASPMAGIAGTTWSARWTGFVEAPTTGTYTFYTTSDDGVRLWVNNTPLINNWTDHYPVEDSGTITLTGGQRYPITLEQYNGLGSARMLLSWAGPGITKVKIPQARLSSSIPTTNLINDGDQLAGPAWSGSSTVSVTSDAIADPTGGFMDTMTVSQNFAYRTNTFTVTPGSTVNVAFRAKTPFNLDVQLKRLDTGAVVQTVATGNANTANAYSFASYLVPAGVTQLQVVISGTYTGYTYAFSKFSATIAGSTGSTCTGVTLGGVSASPTSIGINQTATLNATITPTGTGCNTGVNWSVVSGGGSVSGNTYTAPASAGNVVVRATSAQDFSKTQNVNITVTSNLATLFDGTETTLTKYYSYLQAGATVNFVADPYGSNGQVLKFLLPKASGGYNHSQVIPQDKRTNYTTQAGQSVYERQVIFKNKMYVPNDVDYRKHPINVNLDPHCEVCGPNNIQLFFNFNREISNNDTVPAPAGVANTVVLQVGYSTDPNQDYSRIDQNQAFSWLTPNAKRAVRSQVRTGVFQYVSLPAGSSVAHEYVNITNPNLTVQDLQGKWVDVQLDFKASANPNVGYAIVTFTIPGVGTRELGWVGPTIYRKNQNNPSTNPATASVQYGLYAPNATPTAGAPTSWEFYATPAIVQIQP
jgi:PA14 domain